MPKGYGGLNWQMARYMLDDYALRAFSGSNRIPAQTSGRYLAFNDYGETLAITTPSSLGTFGIQSFIVSPVWNDNLLLTLNGYRNNTILYTKSITLPSVLSAEFVQLNWSNMDKFTMIPSGGTPHDINYGAHFAFDNLCLL